MNFFPELAEKVVAGEKTVTRRMVSNNPRSPWFIDGCSLKPGRSYAVCPGRGKHAIGRVVVTDVRIEMLGRVDEDEARKEGFASSDDFMDAFRSINGRRENDLTWVWRVEFEVDEIGTVR